MSDNTQTLRDQQAQRSREHIVETALRLFAEHGYHGVSTRKIAQAAGITEGLIFHYFSTKADLLTAVLETRHSFLGDLRALLEAARGQSVTEVLPQLASGWLATLYRERAITTVMLGTAQTDTAVNEVLQAAIEEGTSRLAAYLETRIATGELRPDLPARHSALMLYSSLIVFFISHRHLSAEDWHAEAAQFVPIVVELMLRGAYC